MNSTSAVFEAIGQAGRISRAELSRITGFSLMSVGKAVDRLSSIGVVSEEKISTGSVGRKFGMCSLSQNFGMVLLDVSGQIKGYSLNLSLDIIAVHNGGDIAEVMAASFSSLFEAGCTEIIGVACVVPDGDSTGICSELTELLGNEPELVIGRERAFAFANSKRFDCTKTAVFLHISANGSVAGSIMQNGTEYVGANGAAGDVSEFIPSSDVLTKRLAILCRMLDPELVHIACDDEKMCAKIESDIEKSGIGAQGFPKVTVEADDVCKGAFDGAAQKLREKYIFSNFPNNT